MKPPAFLGQSVGLCCRLGGCSCSGERNKIKTCSKKKKITTQRKLETQVGLLGNSPMFKEDKTQILDKLFQKNEKQ